MAELAAGDNELDDEYQKDGDGLTKGIDHIPRIDVAIDDGNI